LVSLAIFCGRAGATIEPPTPPPMPVGPESISFLDLRLVPQLTLASTTGDFSPNGGSRSTASDWKLGGGVSLYIIKTMNFGGRGLRRWGGFLWSVGVDLVVHDIGSVGAGGTLVRFCLEGGVGYGVPFGFWNNFHFELMFSIDGGLATLFDHLTKAAPDSATGWAYGVGVRIGFFYTFDNLWQLGVSTKYRRGWVSLTRDHYYTLDVQTDEGVFGVISVARRF
jgi:hypothetical protein